MDTTPSSNPTGFKTARPCDACAHRRARSYCAADDAFLCQSCDSLVHSANPLARRHQRIRLKALSPLDGHVPSPREPDGTDPTWLRGCKRKARTPRANNGAFSKAPSGPTRAQTLVPELVETSSLDEDRHDDRIMYRVPDFAREIADLCLTSEEAKASTDDVSVYPQIGFGHGEIELEEFTADIESLLGDGSNGRDGGFSIDGMGILGPLGDYVDGCFAAECMKREEVVEEDCVGLGDVDETIELSFECVESGQKDGGGDRRRESSKRARLALDYEAVIAASCSQGLSPWTDGQRPQISLNNSWPEYLGMWNGGGVNIGVQGQGEKLGGINGDGEREARVTRYREKRRMRLFSKKIRYEVRKLNAEKRPRMKGRFVKRTPGLTSFAH